MASRASPRVDKIVGPGNLFVALAKKHVFGEVDIDSIAGPSEVVVIADDSTRPDFAAADLIAQAEHAPGREHSRSPGASEVLEATAAELERQVAGPGARRAGAAEPGAVSARLILVRDADEAAALADEIAPEHLHIATDNAERLLPRDSQRRRGVPGQLQPGGAGRLRRPARRTCCRPAARPGSPAACRRNDFLRPQQRDSAIRAEASWPPMRRGTGRKEGLTAHRASVDVRHPRTSVRRSGVEVPSSDSLRSEFYMSYVRPEIDAMAGYVPGEQPQAGKFIKLNTNENPYPPSPAVARAIEAVLEARAATSIPTRWRPRFRRRAGEVLGVEPDWILCGNGSDDILTIVTRAFVGAGRVAAAAVSQLHPLPHAGRSFRAPTPRRFSSTPTGRCPTAFAAPSDGLRAGVSAESEQPVGHDGVAASAMLELAERLPCPLLVDEAYVDFADDNCLSTGGGEREDHGRADAEQVVRAGRAAVRLPRRAAAGDRAAGEGEGLVQLRRAVDRRGHGGHRRPGLAGGEPGQDSRHARPARRQGMRRLGLRTSSTRKPTFVWCTHAAIAVKPLYEQLKAGRILVRYMNYAGWGDGLRITVGTDEQVERVCLQLFRALAPTQHSPAMGGTP